MSAFPVLELTFKIFTFAKSYRKNLKSNFKMGLVIAFIVIGLLLLMTEILLIPGVGVAGALGLLCLVGSCYWAFVKIGSTTGFIVLAVVVVLLILLLILSLRAKTWEKLALKSKIDTKAGQDERGIKAGDRGETVTRLAPMGSARFSGKAYEVKSLEGMIDPGVQVEVIALEDNIICVKSVK